MRGRCNFSFPSFLAVSIKISIERDTNLTEKIYIEMLGETGIFAVYEIMYRICVTSGKSVCLKCSMKLRCRPKCYCDIL